MTGQKDAAKITKAAMSDRLWEVLQADNHDAEWTPHAVHAWGSRERANGTARACSKCRRVVRQFDRISRGVEFHERTGSRRSEAASS